MRGQLGLMEYVILTFFIVVVIIVLIFFLFGFQVTQLNADQRKGEVSRTLQLAKQIVSSPILVKDEGVFDDGKLTALTMLGDTCSALEDHYGADLFIEVTIFGETDALTPCTQGSYPFCNYWSFCKREDASLAFDFPVNIYRNIGSVGPTGVLPRTDIGLVTVGIYE